MTAATARLKVRQCWTRSPTTYAVAIHATDSNYMCMYIYTVPKKRPPFYFWNNSVKNKLISIIFGTRTPKETWLVDYKFAHARDLKNVATLPSKMQKSHFLITLIIGASSLFKLLPDKTDSSCHNKPKL